MKTKLVILITLLLVLLNSCSLFDFGSKNEKKPATLTSGRGVFLVNEGNFNSGNGSLSFFSFDSLKLFNDLFTTINNRPLGDVPYSLSLFENKLYIVVNNSGKIEVVDINTMKSAATIKGLNSPRNILMINSSKAYVTSLWSKDISVIDLTKDSVLKSVGLRRSSEAILKSGDKVFVSCWVSGNEVMVINALNDRVMDSITVGHEPQSMVIDKNGSLWILCSGGYTGEFFPELLCINTSDYSTVRNFTFPTKSEYPSELTINGTGDTLYYLNNGIFRMPVNANSLPVSPFMSSSGRNFYKIGISDMANVIFATNAVDYQQKGYLLRIAGNGSVIDSLKAGIIPGNMYFKEN